MTRIGPRVFSTSFPGRSRRGVGEVIFSVGRSHPERADGDPLAYLGRAVVRLDGDEDVLEVYATDEIQAVARLMNVSASFLLGEAARGGFQIGTPERAAIADPADLFR